MRVLKTWLGKTILWVIGWRAEGTVPDNTACIVVGYPHTSTLDFPIFVFTSWAIGAQMSWLGKKSLFDGPFGWLFRLLGGLPVDRSGGKDTVRQVAALFESTPGLIVGVAPSGSRAYTEHWRSGFYHMALAAGVPLVCGSIDFSRRVAGMLGMVELTGDVTTDMNAIRVMYATTQGRNPDKQTPVRLREEMISEE